ncbi:MAG: beta-galactosidase [Planctomycetes bacterium]|nr:beta-galactosidase [Planctomycetota bacterium]
MIPIICLLALAAPLPDRLPGAARIPVHAWIGPPSSETTRARYEELAEAGFTHSFSGFSDAEEMAKALEVAREAGIRLFLHFPGVSADPEGTAKRFKDHPAIAGYHITDEPNASRFAGLAEIVKKIQAIDAEHGCYINLFPNYANQAQLGCATYREHVDRFVAEVPVRFISFDHYPIVGDRLRPEWYENLEIIAKAAREAKKPFWAFALAVAHGPYPIPTLAHLRLQVWSDLAYGAQGIQYFTYWTVQSSTWNFHDAPIGKDGERTVVYDRVKAMNAEIRALSPVFLGARILKVGHTGNPIPRGTHAYEPAPPVKAVETGGAGAVVSLIENGGARYLAIVNRDFAKLMPLSIAFDGSVPIGRVEKDGTIRALAERTVRAEVEPGDIAIFTWMPPERATAGLGLLAASLAAAAPQEAPPGIRSVRDFGARGDGTERDTKAIQAAIDAGPGTVVFPAGTYLSGTIRLRSGVTLALETGATLLGSADPADYPEAIPARRSYTDTYVRQALLFADGARGIAIEGHGTIDGQGGSPAFRRKPYRQRPYVIRFADCEDVRVEGVTLRNSPMWMQHYLACENVRIRGIRVFNHVNANNDMLDIDGCRNVVISDCIGDSSDDAITLKSTCERPCENVTISNCAVFSECNGIKFGTESNGGFRNIAVTNCAVGLQRDKPGFSGQRKGLAGIALMIVDGGTMEQVTISNIAIRDMRVPIFLRLGNRARPFEDGMEKPGIGMVRNILISNVVATAVEPIGCSITGLPGHPIEDVSLSDIRLTFPGGVKAEEIPKEVPERPEAYPESTMFGKILPAYGFYCRHVRGLTFRNVEVATAAPDARPAFVFDDVEGLGRDTAAAPRAKLIELGWDIPSTAYLREHGHEMEQSAPFDGVILKVEFPGPAGKTLSSQHMWEKTPWTWEGLATALADLRACRFERFRDNFIRVNATPGDLDWFDDAAWRILCDKIALLGRLARDGGCRGICLDPESYGKPQFRYDPSSGKTFREMGAVARARGRWFVDALAREFPSAAILGLWFNSLNARAGRCDDPTAILVTEGYGLFPAFFDGMLDAAPPAMTFIDGCEHAYRYDGDLDYLRSYHVMRRPSGSASRLVSPENRAKYDRQVRAGFGFYLDAYINPETSPWYIGPGGGTRLERLEANLAAAAEVADAYVWVYGEKFRWWPAGEKHWEEAMPGITRAIEWARDPLAAARDRVAAARAKGALVNLAANAGFEEDALSAWQDEGSKGTFAQDDDAGNPAPSVRAARILNGCLIQRIPVEPGRRYAVEADSLREGTSVPTIAVRWQDGDGKWTRWNFDRTIPFLAGSGPWEHAFGWAQVPDGAGFLVVLLAVHNQMGDGDVCWFDNLGIYRI